MEKLELTKENINNWKKQLDVEMEKHHVTEFSKCNSDEYWIEEYEGCVVDEAVNDELECWDEPMTDIDGNT